MNNSMNAVSKVLQTIADEVPKPRNGSYIGDDGLAYCSVCCQPKQCRITLFGEERILPVVCKCDMEKFESEKKLKESDDFRYRVNALRQEAFPNSNMHNWTFGNDDGKDRSLSKIARNFAENFSEFKGNGKGLLLYGGVGTGKTYAAACIANYLIDKGVPVIMTSFPRIANIVQGMSAGRQEYYDRFNDYPLLILDDLAAERKTEYMQEIVYNVIDTRCSSGLPMIVTSNLTAQEFKNPADKTNERIFSRLLKCCHPIEVKGADRRKQTLKDEFEKTQKLLGI